MNFKKVTALMISFNLTMNGSALYAGTSQTPDRSSERRVENLFSEGAASRPPALSFAEGFGELRWASVPESDASIVTLETANGGSH